MTNSKRKGKRGELEIVRLCKAEGYNCRRTAQFEGKVPEGAADVEGLKGISIEVKFREHLNLDEAMDQSRRDAKLHGKNEIPVVFHRRSRTPWKVTMDIADWFKLYKSWEANIK